MSSILAVIDANLYHSAARNFATALQLMNSEKFLALHTECSFLVSWWTNHLKVPGSTTECSFFVWWYETNHLKVLNAVFLVWWYEQITGQRRWQKRVELSRLWVYMWFLIGSMDNGLGGLGRMRSTATSQRKEGPQKIPEVQGQGGWSYTVQGQYSTSGTCDLPPSE